MRPDVSKTVGDKDSVPVDRKQEMTYGKSNGHVTEIHDGSLAEVCTVWVCFLVCFVFSAITVPAYWLGLRRGAFTCVRWQVILCDPIRQVTSRSCEMAYPLTVIRSFTFTFYCITQMTTERIVETVRRKYEAQVYYDGIRTKDCLQAAGTGPGACSSCYN